jgi:hypothetical protein
MKLLAEEQMDDNRPKAILCRQGVEWSGFAKEWTGEA